jgi:hypothetical protein
MEQLVPCGWRGVELVLKVSVLRTVAVVVQVEVR